MYLCKIIAMFNNNNNKPSAYCPYTGLAGEIPAVGKTWHLVHLRTIPAPCSIPGLISASFDFSEF